MIRFRSLGSTSISDSTSTVACGMLRLVMRSDCSVQRSSTVSRERTLESISSLLLVPSVIHLKMSSSWVSGRSRSVLRRFASRGFISTRAFTRGIALVTPHFTKVLNAELTVKRCPAPTMSPISVRTVMSLPTRRRISQTWIRSLITIP
uniref:(northern house mosquito) hypothetical protein n=1 Tax=Culex pipiens TaxID=7175 RepID=A0A8D8C9W7_CULPI